MLHLAVYRAGTGVFVVHRDRLRDVAGASARAGTRIMDETVRDMLAEADRAYLGDDRERCCALIIRVHHLLGDDAPSVSHRPVETPGTRVQDSKRQIDGA